MLIFSWKVSPVDIVRIPDAVQVILPRVELQPPAVGDPFSVAAPQVGSTIALLI
jgi:hypothetical protein